MTKKIYVGNLSYTFTDEMLSQEFAKFGTVESAKIIMDRETNRSKGFGFVEMGTSAEANQAISKLDGTELEGRQIKVNLAKPQETRGRDSSRRERW